MRWHAIRVITGREFSVLDKLNERLAEVYIPTYTTHSRPGKAKKAKKITRPLFQGYVLARGNEGQWPWVKDIPDVCGYVAGKDGQPLCISTIEIQRIRQAEAMGYHDDEGIAGKIKRGDLLDVLGGPFTGLRVAFWGVRGDHVEAELELLGAKRTVQIPAKDVLIAS